MDRFWQGTGVPRAGTRALVYFIRKTSHIVPGDAALILYICESMLLAALLVVAGLYLLCLVLHIILPATLTGKFFMKKLLCSLA
jgi:hypothetical protein